MFTVIETPLFQSRWPLYRSEEERGAFASFIAAHPNAGKVAPATGGVRKVRRGEQVLVSRAVSGSSTSRALRSVK